LSRGNPTLKSVRTSKRRFASIGTTYFSLNGAAHTGSQAPFKAFDKAILHRIYPPLKASTKILIGVMNTSIRPPIHIPQTAKLPKPKSSELKRTGPRQSNASSPRRVSMIWYLSIFFAIVLPLKSPLTTSFTTFSSMSLDRNQSSQLCVRSYALA
jgi:hypothetical protein